MKIFYKNLKCTFLLLLFAFLFNHVQSQQVTNIEARQDGKKIIITYTLTGKQDINENEIKFFVSTNGGINWEQLTNGITGDVGPKITPGSLKTITWDVLATRNKLQGDNIRFKISASYISDLTFTDSRDGKTYKIVKIGTQTWMAENLNYNTSSGSWCYNNNISNCSKYGRLYDWETAKNVCPSGWHLPNDAEWTKLTGFIGSDVVKKLKSTTGWNSNDNGSDSFGFAAVPGGYRNNDGTFLTIESESDWWSSTEGDNKNAWNKYLKFNDGSVNSLLFKKDLGFSVRCVKDNDDGIIQNNSSKTITKLSNLNIMRDGTLLKVEQALTDFYIFDFSKINDGIKDFVQPFSKNPAVTYSNGAQYNDGRGFTFTFKRPVALGRIVKYGYDFPFDAIIEYYENNSWVKIASIPNKENPQNYDFNYDGSIKSNKWRWYILNYNSTGNMYFYEIEAFEQKN